MQVFGFKGVKNGYKVKKDILSAQDILLALFGRGGGSSALLEPYNFKKSPHNPLWKNTSCFPIMNQASTVFLGLKVNRRQRRSKFIFKKNAYFQGVFKNTKIHSRAVKFVWVTKH